MDESNDIDRYQSPFHSVTACEIKATNVPVLDQRQDPFLLPGYIYQTKILSYFYSHTAEAKQYSPAQQDDTPVIIQNNLAQSVVFAKADHHNLPAVVYNHHNRYASVLEYYLMMLVDYAYILASPVACDHHSSG